MKLTNLLCLPPQPLRSKRWRHPISPSQPYLTLLLNCMTPKRSILLTPAGRLRRSSLLKIISLTSNAMTCVINTLATSKRLQLDEFLQSSGVRERETTTGRPLLERLGMRQLSLLECLGMLIKVGATLQTCDDAKMMTMTLVRLSQREHAIMMMSTTCTMCGTGEHGVGNCLGEVRQTSALCEKPKCSRLSTTSTPRMLSAALMPKGIVHLSLTPSGATSSVTNILI